MLISKEKCKQVAQEINEHNSLVCQTCNRYLQPDSLTRHHLVPRSHKKLWRNSLKFEKENGIKVCYKCHTAIHYFHSNAHLAHNLNTLSLLQTDEKLHPAFQEIAKTGNFVRCKTYLVFNGEPYRAEPCRGDVKVYAKKDT